MDNKHVVVFVDEGPDNSRPSLLLAAEVAAQLGWSNGRLISPAEVVDAEFLNAMHTLSRIANAAYDNKYEDPPFEQPRDLPSVEVSEEFWVSLREYRERRKQEEGK